MQARARPSDGGLVNPDLRLGEGDEYELRAPTERMYDAVHDAKIIDWRLFSFMNLGFDALTASALAKRRDVDREYVARLITRGATVHQVLALVL